MTPGSLEGRPSRLYCGLVALSYMLFAVTLLFFNKAALSSYNFPNANVITLAQLCCANALLYVLRKCRVISFTDDMSLIPRDCINGRTGFPARNERRGEKGGGYPYAHSCHHAHLRLRKKKRKKEKSKAMNVFPPFLSSQPLDCLPPLRTCVRVSAF